MTGTGFPHPGSTRVVGTLPPGIGLTPHGDGTATLSGTPSPGSGGAYTLLVTAENAVGASQTQSLTVDVTRLPAFTSAAATTFTAGARRHVSNYDHRRTPGDARVRHGDAARRRRLPSMGAREPRALAGRPAATAGGVYPLTLVASNGVEPSVVQAFTLSSPPGRRVSAPVPQAIHSPSPLRARSGSWRPNTPCPPLRLWRRPATFQAERNAGRGRQPCGRWHAGGVDRRGSVDYRALYRENVLE